MALGGLGDPGHPGSSDNPGGPGNEMLTKLDFSQIPSFIEKLF